MADAVAAEQDRGFDVAFKGPDLTITGTNANDTILVRKQQDGTLRVQAEGHSGYYDILPDIRGVTINAKGGNNEISVDPDIQRRFWLLAGGGANKLQGGAGDDILFGQGQNNHLSGGAGADLLVAHGAFNVLQGGDGDDDIRGGAGEDIIDGEAGDDVIFSGDGDDDIFGGDGSNTIYAGTGDDNVYSEANSDIVHGGPGNDAVVRLYSSDTGREAQVIDSPDEGSTAHRSGDWLGANPEYVYEER